MDVLNTFIHSPIDGHSGCFQFWALQTKLLWIFVSKSLHGHVLSLLLVKYLRMEWLGQMAGVCLTFEETHLVALFCISFMPEVEPLLVWWKSIYALFSVNRMLIYFVHLLNNLSLQLCVMLFSSCDNSHVYLVPFWPLSFPLEHNMEPEDTWAVIYNPFILPMNKWVQRYQVTFLRSHS